MFLTVRYTRYLSAALLAAGLSGCSGVRDLQPDSETEPTEVVALVKQKYPAAAGMIVKPFVKKKIWNATFYNASALYDILATRTGILSDLRYAPEGPPASFEIMLRTLPVGDGRLSGYRKSEGETVFSGQADYALEGQRQLLVWSQEGASPVRYRLAMHPRAYRQYNTETLTDLPEEIQTLIRTKAAGTFRSATITDEGNHLFYRVSLSGSTFVTNEKQDILYTDGETTSMAEFGELPEAVRNSLEAFPRYAGLDQFRCEVFESGGITGYLAVYYGNNQELFLYLDNSGNVKYHYFTAETQL